MQGIYLGLPRKARALWWRRGGIRAYPVMNFMYWAGAAGSDDLIPNEVFEGV